MHEKISINPDQNNLKKIIVVVDYIEITTADQPWNTWFGQSEANYMENLGPDSRRNIFKIY